MALLSKINSTVIKTINDIRPIGILSNLWKMTEKSLKSIMEDKFPEFLRTGPEQSGFKAGRCTMDFSTLALMRTETNPKTRLSLFIDLKAAYDNVRHSKLFQILFDRAQKLYPNDDLLK